MNKQQRMIEEQQRLMRAMGVDRPEQYLPEGHKDNSSDVVQVVDGVAWTVADILRREG